MELLTALRLGALPRLALIGAGGKTITLFQLARQLLERAVRQGGPQTVLVSATTHMGILQLALADRNFVIRQADDLAPLEADLPTGVVLLTGPQVQPERVAGLDEGAMQRLYALAEARRLPLLLEADGSRCLPVKAPADHEPPLPAWVDYVVVVAGLTALGKPLSPQWVHRPERFAPLAELPPGDPITPLALARVLANPAGGLKNVPAAAQRAALLNQADTPVTQAQALQMAELLLPAFQRVLAAALAPRPGVGMPEPGVLAVYEPAAGVVLAAGGSTRLGRPKQLLPWRGQPLVRSVAQTALQAGLAPVVVVTGAQAQEVRLALQGLPVVIAYNPRWAGGQSTSVIAGLEALPPESGSAVFMLCDQPQAPPTLVRALCDLHARTLAPIVAPQVLGQRGNPVLFDRQVFASLSALTGDAGGRQVFARYPVSWLPWQDQSLLLDVDTEDDYQRLLELQ